MLPEQNMFFVVSLSAVIIACGECTVGVFSRKDNFRFPVVSSTFVALSEIECCRGCQATPGCKAVNVNLGNLTCELSMNASSDGGLAGYAVPDWNFYFLEFVDLALCLPGWSYFNGSCYYPQGQQMSMPNARNECESLHPSAALTDVRSSTEQSFLENFITAQLPTAIRVWIGAYDDGSGTVNFVWRNLEAVNTGYYNWNVNQPQDNTQYCVMISVLNSFKWHDLDCVSECHSICKYALN